MDQVLHPTFHFIAVLSEFIVVFIGNARLVELQFLLLGIRLIRVVADRWLCAVLHGYNVKYVYAIGKENKECNKFICLRW